MQHAFGGNSHTNQDLLRGARAFCSFMHHGYFDKNPYYYKLYNKLYIEFMKFLIEA